MCGTRILTGQMDGHNYSYSLAYPVEGNDLRCLLNYIFH